MSVGADHIAAGSAAAEARADWEAVRASGEIQFAPVPHPEVPIPETPAWLQVLGRILEAIFAPIGRLLGMSWGIFQWVLLALAALLLLYVLWRIGLAWWENRRVRNAGEEPEAWVPVRAEAEALLSDADRLAAQGRYGEATHLLLRRSVRQIYDQRPDWLGPASTAREIAGLQVLPEAGRRAFTVIAERVERSLFALRDLDAGDWQAAREAYADFARLHFREGPQAA